LLVLSSLLLSRQLPAIRVRVLRLATAAFLAPMFAYGWGNIANDFWHEQVVQRGWPSWAVPSVLEPRLTWRWLALVLAAAALWAAWLSLQRSPAAGRTRRPSRAR